MTQNNENDDNGIDFFFNAKNLVFLIIYSSWKKYLFLDVNVLHYKRNFLT